MVNYYAFDIDGVLCHTKEPMKRALEERLGVTLHDDGEYDTYGFSHDSDEVMAELRGCAHDVWASIAHEGELDKNALEVLHRLDRYGRLLCYVTRRPLETLGITQQWLTRHQLPIGIVMCMDLIRLSGNLNGCKSQAVRQYLNDLREWRSPHFPNSFGVELPYDQCILVEDGPHEAISAALNGLRVMVLRRPYNRQLEQRLRTTYNGHLITFIDSLEELS